MNNNQHMSEINRGLPSSGLTFIVLEGSGQDIIVLSLYLLTTISPVYSQIVIHLKNLLL